MNRPILACLSLVLAVCTTSCATMFDGTTNDIHFTSEPPGATVRAGEEVGRTPCTLDVAKSLEVVTITYPNGPEMEWELEREFSSGYLLMDILFTPGFGLSGILVDASSGAWWKHRANEHHDLEGALASQGPPEDADPPTS